MKEVKYTTIRIETETLDKLKKVVFPKTKLSPAKRIEILINMHQKG